VLLKLTELLRKLFLPAKDLTLPSEPSLIGHFLYWRHAYFLGAVLGLALVLFRLNVEESSTYLKFKHTKNRGNIIKFFRSEQRLLKFFIFVSFGFVMG
jgi:hypothetical protein